MRWSEGAAFEPDPGALAERDFERLDPDPESPFQASSGEVAPAEPAAPNLEEALREAYERGRAEARAELPVAEAAALARAAEALERGARALGVLRRDLLRAHRHAVVELAFAIAERVLGRAVRADAEGLADRVAEALEILPEGQPETLRLSPADVETLRAGEAGRLARLAEEHRLEIVADPRLEPGDARIFAGRSEVDARLGEILDRLRAALHDLADGEPDASVAEEPGAGPGTREEGA